MFKQVQNHVTKVSLNESRVRLGTAFFSVILRGYINKTKVIFNFLILMYLKTLL